MTDQPLEIRKFCPNSPIVKKLGEQMESVVETLEGVCHRQNVVIENLFGVEATPSVNGQVRREGGMIEEVHDTKIVVAEMQEEMRNGLKVKIRFSKSTLAAIITGSATIIAALIVVT